MFTNNHQQQNRVFRARFCYTETMFSKHDLLRRQAMNTNVREIIHRFFRSRGYLEFQTPLLVRYPDMSPELEPVAVELDVSNPSQATIHGALITSPEFSMKKLIGAGLERIYTITPCFRAGEALFPHNTPEFTMLEWYRVGGNYQDCMQETEALVNLVLEQTGSWPRIEYSQANVDELGDPHVAQDRFFVMNYPPEKAALAKLSEDKTYAERFEAFLGGFELCNGFSELLDANEQRKRFEFERNERIAKGKRTFDIDEELLEALTHIQKPVCGNALGVDRLVMLKYGIGDINDIQLFPARERFSS